MSEEFEGFTQSRIERAWEPPEEVVITRALAESPDLDYDDYGVLIRLLLRDPDQPTNVPDLMKEFQASGWSIGEKPLRRIMRRLKKAGHVSHGREYDPVTKRPEWVFRTYRNPANNPQYTSDGVTALSQVRPIGPNQPDRGVKPSPDRAESAVFAGQTDRADSAGSAPIGPNRPDRKGGVSAGQADRCDSARSEASPPHPPEGEDPPPPTPSSPAGSLPSQREEEAGGFAEEETSAAERFLQEMKRWQAGAATARKCAPRLLRAMRAQGWPALTGLDDEHLALLEAEILKNTGGAASWTKCLPLWVDDLRLYDRVKSRPRAEKSADVCRKPGHGGGAFPADDCPECARESRPKREGASRVDTAALISLLHSKKRGTDRPNA